MAMEYITSKKVIHRYLAAKHILLDDPLRCKVSNFSYSEGVMSDSEFFRVTNECEQCFRWISLETFEERSFTTKTDIWSFGVVMWEIFTYGLLPYVGHCKEDVVEKLKRGYRLLKPDYVDGDVYNLMEQCWIKRPNDRPTFTSLLSRLEALREKEEVPAEHYKELDGFFESEYITPGQIVFEVNHNFVRIEDVLYKGEFGDIFAGETSQAGKEKLPKKIAIKIPKGEDEMVTAKAASKEVEVMKTLSNTNVISLLAYSTNKEKPYLILEYSQHGNLKAYLQRNRAKFLIDNNAASQEQLLSFAVDIAKGMKHIASHRIIHRYLAAKHVLVCNELTCKISNLSYTSDVSDGSRFTKLAERGELPYPWMAPESLTNWTFSVKSDVWSFGVVLWEIATLGCDPFENSTKEEVVSLLQRGIRLQRYTHIDENLYDLMLACWQKMPKERLSFSTILQRTKQLKDSKDELLKFELYN
ncbi:tyrosine kinase receptor Cad96Ca-like isoform X1 [Ptychodera flava]|uniref:tyrosine kinase receptor Cad96Ca-like isoform X1 n=2 Tax=Ptychodera flava TaxID=63121 RepID=UPI00396A4DD4